MCEKLQASAGTMAVESIAVMEGLRISAGVENMFFNPNFNNQHLSVAKSKLEERIREIDVDGEGWEILTERECNKKHNRFLAKKEICTVICEEVGEHKLTYLFAIKGPSKAKSGEYQETLKWQEVYSVL